MDINDFIGRVVREESRKIIKKANKKSKRALTVADEQMESLFGITLETTKDVCPVSVKKPGAKQIKIKVKSLPKKNKTVKTQLSGIKKTTTEKIGTTLKNRVVKKKSTVKKSVVVKKAAPVKKKVIIVNKKKIAKPNDIAGSSKPPAGLTRRKK